MLHKKLAECAGLIFSLDFLGDLLALSIPKRLFQFESHPYLNSETPGDKLCHKSLWDSVVKAKACKISLSLTLSTSPDQNV